MTTTPRLESISLVDHDLIDSVARAMSLSTRSEISKLKDALFPTLLCAAAKAADIAAMEQLVSCVSSWSPAVHRCLLDTCQLLWWSFPGSFHQSMNVLLGKRRCSVCDIISSKR